MSPKARYQAVLHLTEMVLSRREEDAQLAAQLIKIYVHQLQVSLAHPATKFKGKLGVRKFRKQRQNSRKRRGNLQEDDNRLVRTLINGIHRAIPYLEAGIVTGSPLEADTVEALFKVCHTVSAFSTRIAILGLLYRCFFSKGDPPDRFYRLLYEQLAQFDFWTSTHRQKAYLLLRQSVPTDRLIGRGVAVARRLLQVGANMEPAIASVGLAVLRELLLAHQVEIKRLIGTSDRELGPPPRTEDDAEEVFVDDDACIKGGCARTGLDNVPERDQSRYKPLAREPRYANSQQTPMWELHALSKHVHPFVAYGAKRLMAHESFEDAGSNLFEHLSCGELLEQFAYVKRQPKTRSGAGAGKKRQNEETRLLCNSNNFSKKKNVQPHERFFQIYFRDTTVQQQQLRKAKQRKQQGDDVDEEHVADTASGEDEDEADRFFDDYLKGEPPADEEGPDEDDDPDIDDDSDLHDEDASVSGGEGGSEDADSDAPTEGGADSGSSDDGDVSVGHGKRKATDAKLPATRKDKVKALRKKYSDNKFASAEDFAQLIAEDDAV